MNSNYDFDLAVIGGGSGGYAAARVASGAGLKTAVIEGGREVGGLCILRGCMPTKALLYAAEVMHLTSHPQAWGVRAENVSFDFARVWARKDALVQEFADHRSQQLSAGKFTFHRALARFEDAHTVALKPIAKNADGSPNAPSPQRLTARNFVIATGSAVAPPPLADLGETGYLDSDSALELTRLPRSLIVLGGGAVAVEFTQFFARFGVNVTVIQRGPTVLRMMDADAGEVLEQVLRREGVTIYTGARLLASRRLGALKEVTFDQDGRTVRVQAEEILFALGRVPNIASLALDRAGVELGEGRVNRIKVNPQMQTTAPHIFAAGDCAGPHEVVHIAVMQGEIAGHNAAHPDQMRALDNRFVDRGRLHRAANRQRGTHGKTGPCRRHPLSRGEVSIWRPRQIVEHGGAGRFR